MIPMRQFLREHDVSGDVKTCIPEQPGTSSLDGTAYRLHLRRDLRTFEATLQRPVGAPAPSLGEAVAELARTVSTALDGPQTPEVLREAERLRAFLGEHAYRELLFEFGHRPEGEIEAGDTVGEPARPDEMTNQEPEALAGASRASRPLGRVRLLIGAPLIVIGTVAVLVARGRRAKALAIAAGGAVTTVTAATGIMQWRRRAQRTSVQETLEALTDQNTSIQTGSTRS